MVKKKTDYVTYILYKIQVYSHLRQWMQFPEVPNFLKQSFKRPTDFQIKPKQCNCFHLNFNLLRERTAQTHFVGNSKQTSAEIHLELKQSLLKYIYYCHY